MAPAGAMSHGDMHPGLPAAVEANVTPPGFHTLQGEHCSPLGKGKTGVGMLKGTGFSQEGGSYRQDNRLRKVRQGGVARKVGFFIAAIGTIWHTGVSHQETLNPEGTNQRHGKDRGLESNFPLIGNILMGPQGTEVDDALLTPSAEANHDQKKGVRIGESRIPAQPEQDKKKEKTWTAITANITSWNTSGLAWAVHRKDDILMLQETRLAKKQIRGAKSAASRQGFHAVFAPAMKSIHKGLNLGGVGVMVREPRKVKQVFPPVGTTHFEKGRWIHAVTEGQSGAGLHISSIYGYDTGKKDHDRLNMELDQEVFGAIAALNGAAWIAGGDWNRTPEMIAESGATEPVGGFIAPGREQVETCVPEKGEHRVLDFFILGPGIRDVNTKVEVLLDSTIATHRPVQATFTGNPMVQEVMGLTVPKPYEFTPLQLKTRNYVKHKEVPEPRSDDTEQAIT